MAFIALVITLLIEQLRPLPTRTALSTLAAAMADGAERRMNAGRRRHGMYAWMLIVGGCALGVYVLHALAVSLSWFIALAFTVAVLYVTMGFRQFSHHFTEIQLAIAAGDLASARRELTLWKRAEHPDFDATTLEIDELIRQSLEYGLLKAQRHVFGVLFWYAVFAWAVGPLGAVVYRLADFLARHWNAPAASALAPPPDRFARSRSARLRGSTGCRQG